MFQMYSRKAGTTSQNHQRNTRNSTGSIDLKNGLEELT